ncbi:MAG: hypothetical protein Q9170_003862 [Blastenia crenularia]
MSRKSLSTPNIPLNAARQTRRRTSPEDQIILEAAYKQNTKPDKAARSEIASRVSLGEKEISIWFQNKRQVSRRRSRPFDSEEIFSTSFNSSQESGASLEETKVQNGIAVEGKLEPLSSTQTSLNDSQTKSNQASPEVAAVDHDVPLLVPKTTKVTKEQRGSNFVFSGQADQDPTSAPILPPTCLKRTVSQPRLCTSLDGSVRIKTGLSPSPSPPRLSLQTICQPRIPGSLQRSQSAITPSTITGPRPLTSIGRSRDSRTWEFYCDANTKDELTRQAEREQKGSAAGAIALTRSLSKGSLSASTITGVTNKRVSTSTKSETQKRFKPNETTSSAKPKLARASSSVARLQSTVDSLSSIDKSQPTFTSAPQKGERTKKKSAGIDLFIDGNESDKENWVPGTQATAAPRRRQGKKPAARSRVLQENIFLSADSTSLSSRPGKGRSRTSAGRGNVPSKESLGSQNDDEAEAFMRRDDGIVGEGDDEDLQGVQGLLSLSQGAWFRNHSRDAQASFAL